MRFSLLFPDRLHSFFFRQLRQEPLTMRLSPGFSALVGIAHSLPNLAAPSIRPSTQYVWTRRGDTFHISAASLMLMYPSIIFSSTKTKNIADIEISNVINPNCNWLPFYRPCSFVSYPFEYFAKFYIFLSYSDKRRMSIRFNKSAMRCSIFCASALYVKGSSRRPPSRSA